MPGTLLKDSIPMRTWAEWDEAVPGFVEIDLVGHEGGNSRGEFCFTPDITDIATGWTETRSVKNKAQKWVFAAIKDATATFPFPVLGIDSDNGSEFINWELLFRCEQEKLTFTRSRVGMARAGGQCEMEAGFRGRCSRPAEHGDHFYPWSKGGSTSLQNFVAACARCNRAKGARVPSPGQQNKLEQRRRNYVTPDGSVSVGERQPLRWRAGTQTADTRESCRQDV